MDWPVVSEYLPNLVAAGAVMLIFVDWLLSDLRSWNGEVEIEEKSRFDEAHADETSVSPMEARPAEERRKSEIIELTPVSGGRFPFWVMLASSAAILGLSGYVIMSGEFDALGQRWAFGAGGILVGYWLKPT